MHVLIAYTRFVEEKLTRPEHFFETFADCAFGERLEVAVDTGVDHTHTELVAQAALVARIDAFMGGMRGGATQ